MAALDFPVSPAVGQVYNPSPSQPTYVWNGSLWVRSPAIIGSPTAGYRNVVINGDMQICQRNNLAAAAGARNGPLDRWQLNSGGSTMTGTFSYSSLGGTPKEAFGYYGTTVASVAGAGNYAMLLQRIEGVRQLAGKRCTLSFSMAADAARPAAVEIDQYFGSGGSPSATVQTQLGKVTLGVPFQRFAIPFDMPSISGKTIGTNNDDFLQLKFWMDAGSTYNVNSSNLGQQSGSFYLSQVQLEEGSFATPFERRPWHAEYALCLRYYETAVHNIGFACASTGGYADDFTYWFKATKRAAPTVVHSPSSFNNASTWNNLGSTPDWIAIQLVGSALGNTGAYWNWTASAEL